ncbi:MAG TPA: F0F1 ATP synthase subunit B, partial [Gemmatimonadales bacterium]
AGGRMGGHPLPLRGRMKNSLWLTPTLLGGMVSQASAQEPAGGPLSVDGGLVIWTLVVFGLTLFILRRWAWPVMLQAVRDREARLEKELADAERMNAEAKAALEEHKKLLAGSKADAIKILSDAKVIAQKEREVAMAKTRAEQEALLERAKRDIQAEKDKAAQDLRREAVELSLAAASRLIGQKLDNEANRKLVSDYLGELGGKH